MLGCSGLNQDTGKSDMPIDYRSELRRPFSLVLAGVAVLGLLLALGLWLSYSTRLQASRAETTGLQQAEVAVRGRLEEQQRTAGTLADLQTRVSAAQREMDQLGQNREQAQAQLTALQQTFQTIQQQLTRLQSQLPQAEQRLTAVREQIATGEQVLGARTGEVAEVGRQLEDIRRQEAAARETVSRATQELSAKTTDKPAFYCQCAPRPVRLLATVRELFGSALVNTMLHCNIESFLLR
jgi:small-conductance mechanosensitive channel